MVGGRKRAASGPLGMEALPPAPNKVEEIVSNSIALLVPSS